MQRVYTRAELIAIRERCDRDLLYFTRFFYFLLNNKKFIVNWHHEELCKHFEDLTSYKLDLLNINIPPRCSKTEIMKMAICRGIGMRHSSNWLYITASDTLRKKTTVEMRRILTHPYFKIMYGLEIEKDQNSRETIGFVGGGSLTTCSIFGQITGFGAGEMTDREVINHTATEEEKKRVVSLIKGFEGAIFCDDLNKIKDSESLNANNQAVIDTVFDTVFSRKNSNDTPFANIQQRAGTEDVTNGLLELYGIDENPKETIEIQGARFVIMPVIYPDGRLLWEFRYPLHKIEQLRTSVKTGAIFDTQYMQNPTTNDDLVFPKKDLNYFTLDELNKEHSEYNCGAIDVADEGTDCLSFPHGILIGRDFYVTDWIFTKDNTEITAPRVAANISLHKLDLTAIESNNHGAVFCKNVANLTNGYLMPLHNEGNKHSRINHEAINVRLNFFFRSDIEIGSEYYLAMKALTSYHKTKNKEDDAPDSIALLSKVLRTRFPERFY